MNKYYQFWMWLTVCLEIVLIRFLHRVLDWGFVAIAVSAVLFSAYTVYCLEIGQIMTKDEILNMPAGGEMDALIADKIFGAVDDDDWGSDGQPAFSTDISAAWEVVEKLLDKFTKIEIRGSYWFCVFDWGEDEKHVFGVAETPMLAICRAAFLTTL